MSKSTDDVQDGILFAMLKDGAVYQVCLSRQQVLEVVRYAGTLTGALKLLESDTVKWERPEGKET
jgi:hypothetical protein